MHARTHTYIHACIYIHIITSNMHTQPPSLKALQFSHLNITLLCMHHILPETMCWVISMC